MPVILPNDINNLSVPFEILPDGYLESYSFTNGECAVSFKCLWDDRKTLAKELLGGIIFSPEGSGGFDDLAFLVGMPHPDDELSSLRVIKCDVRPFFPAEEEEDTALSPAVDKTWGKWTHAQIDAFFSTSGPAQSSLDQDDPTIFIEEDFELGGEMLTGPAAGMCWENTGSVEDQEPAGFDIPGVYKFVPTGTWRVTIHQIDNIPNSFFDNVGLVNAAAIQSPKFIKNFGLETVLYEGLSIRNTYSLQLQRETKSVTLSLKWKGPDEGQTWNTFWRFTENAWVELFSCGTAQARIKPYNTGDLGAMLGAAFTP